MASSVTPKLESSASTDGKKTVCGACGRDHRTWYGRKVRRVRDLPCGDTRIYLELEVRRVECNPT